VSAPERMDRPAEATAEGGEDPEAAD